MVDFVAGLLFALDVAINFHVGYVAQQGMRTRAVTSRRGVARLYCLRGTLLVDVLSSLAWFAQVPAAGWAGGRATLRVHREGSRGGRGVHECIHAATARLPRHPHLHPQPLRSPAPPPPHTHTHTTTTPPPPHTHSALCL